VSIDSLLQSFQHFGVHLGLERIERLLADLGNPQQHVPLIQVAGTNGKGSVCAYLSSVLSEAGYRVGRYTSPHLVDWTERICLNEQLISPTALQEILQQIQAAINPDNESPTQFEVITAAAWLYFAQQQVDIAVMEVGLGGRLDATNVCDRSLVSIITSLSWEHWQNLGSTLAEIATEKAGILKPGCPAVVGTLPPEAQAVVAARIEQLNCPAIWVQPAQQDAGTKGAEEQGSRGARKSRGVGEQGSRGANKPTHLLRPSAPGHLCTETSAPPHLGTSAQNTSSLLTPHSSHLTHQWASYQGISYPLPLLGEMQLTNSAIAIAALQILQQQGWNISPAAIQTGMAKTRVFGRIQWTSWHDHSLLIDGAHNVAAAQALRQYVDTLDTSITWVMGMLSTKAHAEILKALLRPADQLYLVPVPSHSSADTRALATIAKESCPEIADCQTFPELFSALETAIASHHSPKRSLVLCGSLYLVGYFLSHQKVN
jgi:dihydrofolate synthase/folylpolyglutamate synthase